MTIRTSGGHIVETLEAHGRSTPYDDVDRYTVIRVAVDGRPYRAFQWPTTMWDEQLKTWPEAEHWQSVADYALSFAVLGD